VTQEEVLKIVISTLEKNNIPYMLTGAIAVNYCGRPRLTHRGYDSCKTSLVQEIYLRKAHHRC